MYIYPLQSGAWLYNIKSKASGQSIHNKSWFNRNVVELHSKKGVGPRPPNVFKTFGRPPIGTVYVSWYSGRADFIICFHSERVGGKNLFQVIKILF